MYLILYLVYLYVAVFTYGKFLLKYQLSPNLTNNYNQF